MPYPQRCNVTAAWAASVRVAPRHPLARALRNTQGDRGNGLGWKIHTRAHGGYVLAPGSLIDARPYTITHDTVSSAS